MTTDQSLAGIATTTKRTFYGADAYTEFRLHGWNEELWRGAEALAGRLFYDDDERGAQRYW